MAQGWVLPGRPCDEFHLYILLPGKAKQKLVSKMKKSQHLQCTFGMPVVQGAFLLHNHVTTNTLGGGVQVVR